MSSLIELALLGAIIVRINFCVKIFVELREPFGNQGYPLFAHWAALNVE